MDRELSEFNKQFTVRPAKIDDCGVILKLIKELAEFENHPTAVKIDENVLRSDGFGENPFFHSFVAEVDDGNGGIEIVGYALYFYIYSTWEGRAIYMEDLYVKPQYRHKGLGNALWRAVAEEGVNNGCKRLDFAVLDWNDAIEFYKKKGAINITTSVGFHIFRIKDEALYNLANGKEPTK